MTGAYHGRYIIKGNKPTQAGMRTASIGKEDKNKTKIKCKRWRELKSLSPWLL